VGRGVTGDDEFDFLGGSEPTDATGAVNSVELAMQQRLAGDDVAAVLAAVRDAERQGLAGVQVAVIERLGRDPRALGHIGVDTVLHYLDALADGRGVRAMETVLAERGSELSDAHAWRLRHIVQRVRRFGRK
jgi:hypothetical protein